MAKRTDKAQGEGTPLTANHQRFCALVAKGMAPAEAYRTAISGARNSKPETIWANSSRLMADARVSLRIDELRTKALAKVTEKHCIDVERITEMLIDDRDKARELEQMSTAVTAAMGLAKLHGLIVDKASNVNVNVNFADLLRARLSKSLADT